MVSNGYVALAPYRSELFATGIQNFNVVGSASFLDLLCFHEYRHALQNSNSRRGFTKFLYLIGCESFWSTANGVGIPDWYLEGDAVQTETMFTGAGRGRTPYFSQEQCALLLNNTNYALPLFYPDFGGAGIFFINRIKANVFCDISTVRRDALDKTFDQNSVGAEILFDFKLVNFMKHSAGFRYSSLMNPDYIDKVKPQHLGLSLQDHSSLKLTHEKG